MPLEQFSPATRAWFDGAFSAPTQAQIGAWQSIAEGHDTLVVAPTGSGKTLAAFLWSLDRLATDPSPSERCRVLYVSPLKALAVDVERNLRSPLAGIRREAARAGLTPPDIRIGVRTGDTPADERRRLVTHPPDVLITTPESLFLLMTSQARTMLTGVESVIVDEIHAVAGTKRGAHLALTLERLEAFIRGEDPDRRVQRIGLSATVRPIGEVARYLRPGAGVRIVDPASAKEWDLRVVVPVEDMADLGRPTGDIEGSAAGDGERTSIWPHVDEEIANLIAAHRSTLIFVNSRRLAERLTARLNDLATERAGEPTVVARAHHGSVSREQRSLIEEDLKAGRLPAVVATSSLELGIDMGAVDLVVQVEAPPSVASGLQRVGRAGHQVGAVSRGVVIPKYRGDLVTSAVVLDRMRAGAIESLAVPRNPLDVLAQQIVAATAMDEWDALELLDLVRRAAPYTDLPESAYRAVVDMLAGRYPGEEFAELRPRIVWDRDTDTLTARRGAQRLAVTSGGTIPDRGLFAVYLVGGSRVGELDEEMVYESRAGDVIALGASSWRIEEITHDRVFVSPAPGQPARMPFWRGDSLGRPVELGRAQGAFLRELSAVDDAAAGERLRASGLDERATRNLMAYLAEQRIATGVLPDDRTIVVERFRDELGDWRVAIHTPLGARVHAPWALALAARLRADHALEPQVMHSDDGIVLRLPDTVDDDAARAVADLLMIDADEVEQIVTAEIGGSALFASRFRECAARALLLPRRMPGRRTPLWQQRQRSAHLLGVAAHYPEFPIVLETVRECLQDVFDLPGLREVLAGVAERQIRVVDVETATPSPFAQSLLLGYIAAFLYDGDAPLAERRAAALTVDASLLAELLGQTELRDLLDADALAAVVATVGLRTRAPRDAEDVADLLRRAGPFDDPEVADRGIDPEWLVDLVVARRAIEVRLAGRRVWAAIEDAGVLRDALGVALPPGVAEAFTEPRSDPLGDLVGRHARTHGPFTTDEVAERFGLGRAVAQDVLRRLAASGRLVEGAFTPGAGGLEWCDLEVLRHARRRSVAALRAEVEPVAASTLARFLPQWQGVGGDGPTRRGADGLLETLDQLAGVPMPASQLESWILPARVTDYSPAMLDGLLSAGQVVWWGAGALPGGDGWICLSPADVPLWPEPPALDGAAGRIINALAGGGSWLTRDLAARLDPPVPDLVEVLWDLLWTGAVTLDTLAPLRARLGQRNSRGSRPATRPATRPAMRRGRLGRPTRSALPVAASGRWSRLPDIEADRALTLAETLLARYGVVTRAAVAAEGLPGGFAAAYSTLRMLEEAGRCRRVYALEGLGAAQFALTSAVDRVRAAADSPGPSALVLAAADPAQPYGAALPWPDRPGSTHRPTRAAGAVVVLVGDAPVIYVERGGRSLLSWDADGEALRLAANALVNRARASGQTLGVQRIDGEAALASPLAVLLQEAGFVTTPRALRLRT